MQDEMKKYFVSLKRDFGEQAAAVLVVVQASAFCCSLICRNGIRLHFPVAVVVESVEQMEQISSTIAVFSSRVNSLNATPKEFTKAILDGHDEVLWFHYAKGRYSEQNFERLLTACNTGEICEEPFEAVAVIFFTHWIPVEYSDNFSLIINPKYKFFIHNMAEKIAYLDVLEEFILKKFCFIMEDFFRIDQSQSQEVMQDDRFWQCGIRLLNYIFSTDEEGAELKAILDFDHSCRLAAEAAENYDLVNQLPEMFKEAAIQFCPKIRAMVAKKDAGRIMPENRQELPLFDEDFYYFPEGVFRKICEPLFTFCPMNQIKAALEAAGILSSQGRGRIYRTVKIRVDGSDDSPRYIKLQRCFMDGPEGELTFEERINTKGETNEKIY